jgi:hypothetical protein
MNIFSNFLTISKGRIRKTSVLRINYQNLYTADFAICSKQKAALNPVRPVMRKIPNKNAAEFQKLLEMYFKKEKNCHFTVTG